MLSLSIETQLLLIKDWPIIHLPLAVSQQLPSRGMLMVEATLNGHKAIFPLEPDGMGSHWFLVDPSLCKEFGLKIGHRIALRLTPTDHWLEADVPRDLLVALSQMNLSLQWATLTTKARWAWIRWIRFTNNPETRASRIQTTCSMLTSGKKRPCCFDHSRCTESYVSKSGKLLVPD